MNITKYEEEDSLKVHKAVKLIANLNQKNYELAAEILLEVIKNTPEDYVYKFVDKGKLNIKFWNKDEFMHFVTFKEEVRKYNEVIWLLSAYPKAYYYFGIILSKGKEFEKAILSYNKGYELEPTNPYFFIGLGNTFSSMKDHKKALECYQFVGKVNPFITPKIKALALRSEGVQLIELGRLNEAKKSLMLSLDIEPQNVNATNELLLIDEIEKGERNNHSTQIIDQFNKKVNRCMYCLKDVNEGIMKKVNNHYYFICKECEHKGR